MDTVRFIGKVLPAPSPITYSPLPTSTATLPGIGRAIFSGRVEKSLVDITVTVSRFERDHIPPLYRHALSLTRACVEAAAFAMGRGLIVIIESLVNPDGTLTPLYFVNHALVGLVKSFKFPFVTEQELLGFNTIVKLVLSEPPLGLALNDLIQANSWPSISFVNCTRAVEGIRNMIVPVGTPPDQAWVALQSSLNLDASYLKFISNLSRGPRHGRWDEVSETVGEEMMKRTWTTMDRFIEFRKRGNTPLPMAEFPVLTG